MRKQSKDWQCTSRAENWEHTANRNRAFHRKSKGIELNREARSPIRQDFGKVDDHAAPPQRIRTVRY